MNRFRMAGLFLGGLIIIVMFLLVLADYTVLSNFEEGPRITLTPINPFIEAGENITINISVQKPCTAQCIYTFEGRERKVKRSFDTALSSTHSFPPQKRSGQDWYTAKVVCVQEKSTLCPAREVHEQTVITVSKELNETQKREKQEAEKRLVAFKEKRAYLSSLADVLNISTNETLEEEETRLLSLWKTESFSEVQPPPLQEEISVLEEQLAQENEKRNASNMLLSFKEPLISVLHFHWETAEVLALRDYIENTTFSPRVPDLIIAANQTIHQAMGNVSVETCEAFRNSTNQTCTPINNTPLITRLSSLQEQSLLHVERTAMSIPPPEQLCCGITCKVCCEHCTVDSTLFIHGHAFTEKNSPSYSLTQFALLQEVFENTSLNAGELYIDGITNQSWARYNTSLTFRGSYYYVNTYGSGVVVRKNENIETYALRLKELVDAAQRKTGGKVNIVAHSMGGLVARQYVATFGREKIGKLVFVNTPHHGIREKEYAACVLFGADTECGDMKKGSLFLQRLNAQPVPESTNIITMGCTMGNTTGDGIVTKESATLKGAEEIMLEEDCKEYLHTEILYMQTFRNVLQEILE